MLLPSFLLGAPLAWSAHRVAGVHSYPSSSSALKMDSGHETAAQAYAGIFSHSTGISRAWALAREGSETLMVQRTARDIEGNKIRSFVQSYELKEGQWRQSSPFPMELNEAVVFSPSPSGKLLAVIKQGANNDKCAPTDAGYVMEIWGNDEAGGRLIDQIPTTGVHGKIVGGTWFGGLSWSPDESKVVYVAQKKAPDTRSFFAKPSTEKAGSAAGSAGDQFLYQEDWGEKYDGVTRVGLFVADIAGSGRVDEIGGISSQHTPGQPRFAKDGRHVIYTAWECEPRKLGMIYCYQRPCNLYSTCVEDMLGSMEIAAKGPIYEKTTVDTTGEEIDQVDKKHRCLCPSWRLARSARFSPSGESLVWLSREEGFDTHSGCFRLSFASWDSEHGALAGPPRTLVDAVDVPEAKDGFPGLWMDDLPDACWTPDGKYIFLTSAWGSRQSVVRVDAATGSVVRVVGATAASKQDPSTGEPDDASAAVLTVGDGGVYVVGSSPNSPGGFAVLPAAGVGGVEKAVLGPAIGGASVTPSVRLSRIRSAELRQTLGDVRWRVVPVPVHATDGDDGGDRTAASSQTEFEAILLMPPLSKGGSESRSSVPLVVVPHGGPHSVMPTAFVPSYAFLSATQGFAVLHVNFRGSTGFGTTALESLPGRIGTQDVADVLAATKAALALEPDALDPRRVGVVGGSHGGFLGAHLTAQHPDVFKVTALRNPVTNIASMVTASDIPDWCYVEALGCGKYDWNSYRPPTAEEVQKMWKASPVAHIGGVIAPTLVALGAKDRRVPQSQGVEWFHALKSKGVKAKLLVYPEDVHAIDKPASEADQWLNIADWLKEHL